MSPGFFVDMIVPAQDLGTRSPRSEDQRIPSMVPVASHTRGGVVGHS